MVRTKSSPKTYSKIEQSNKIFVYSAKRPNSDFHKEAEVSLLPKNSPLKKKKKSLSPELEALIDSYLHSLNITKSCDNSSSNRVKKSLLTFDLPLSTNVAHLYDQAASIKLYFNDKEGLLMFYSPDSDNQVNTIPIVRPNIFPVMFMLSAQVFIVNSTFSTENQSLNLEIYLKDNAVHHIDNLCNLTSLKQIDYSKVINLLKTVLDDNEDFDDHSDLLFTYEVETADTYLPLVNTLYDTIQNHHDNEIKTLLYSDLDVQHPSLKCTLRGYQSDAIRWMIKQEQKGEDLSSEQSEILNTMFKKFYVTDNEKLYFNAFTGRFLHNIPALNTRRKGGILADEMGLGKTVEMLGLILNSKNEDWSFKKDETFQSINYLKVTKTTDVSTNGEIEILCTCGTNKLRKLSYILQCSVCSLWQHSKCVGIKEKSSIEEFPVAYKCPRCWIKARVSGKATLIISPDSIWQQWHEEIMKHVHPDAINVYMYKGVSSTKYIQPVTLAKSDIVLTSYSVLQREFCLTVQDPRDSNIGESRGRTPKKYLRLSSPLLSIVWRRVCFDEAQMIEKVTTIISKMALQFEAQYYWCVTGTPIQKCISDIYGLLCLFAYEPFCAPFWWNSLLLQPFLQNDSRDKSLLVRVLTGLLWRNTKTRVADQLCLPSLNEKTHQLQLSAVERHLYEQLVSQSQESLHTYLDTLHDLEDNCLLSKMPQSQYTRLLAILSRLRQACTHPSLVFKSDTFSLGKGFKSAPIHNKCLTMSEVLFKMIASRKKLCKDLCRSWVFFKNGAAGFLIIQKKYREAAQCYHDVLQSQSHISSYGVEIDSAQQLHIMTNLSWLLNSHGDSIDRVADIDDDLLGRAQNLRKKFIKNFMESVVASMNKLTSSYQHQNLLINQSAEIVSWLQEVLTLLNVDSLTLPDFHASDKSQSGSSTNNYRKISRSALIYAYHELLQKRDHMQVTLQSMFPRAEKHDEVRTCLEQDPHYHEIVKYSQCCMYKNEEIVKDNASSCPMCAASKVLGALRVDLSSARASAEKYLGEDSVANKNTTLVAAVWEIIRRLESSYLPDAENVRRLIGFGRVLVNFLSSIKQELSLSSKFLINLGDLWAFQHQAEQFTKRMQSNSRSEECYISEEEAIVDLEQSLNDATFHRDELERSLHQLAFLTQSTSPSRRKYCAPCMRHMSPTLPLFILLRCWHSVCSECFEIMRLMEKTRRRCPVCRQAFGRLDVERPIVTSHQEEEEAVENDHNQQLGQMKRNEHSSKVCKVVDCLKDIIEKDDSAKAIVFSSWSSVLNTIHSALLEAGYPHASFMNARNTQDLASFKWAEEKKILLIPVHLGCNGLNLTEANHVLLVDPLLNPGHEAQAIARIHRMGQMKCCTVHRFVALNTVEESLNFLHTKQRREVEDKNNVVGSDNKEKVNITLRQFKELFC